MLKWQQYRSERQRGNAQSVVPILTKPSKYLSVHWLLITQDLAPSLPEHARIPLNFLRSTLLTNGRTHSGRQMWKMVAGRWGGKERCCVWRESGRRRREEKHKHRFKKENWLSTPKRMVIMHQWETALENVIYLISSKIVKNFRCSKWKIGIRTI